MKIWADHTETDCKGDSALYPIALPIHTVLIFPFREGQNKDRIDFLLTVVLIACGPQTLYKLITFVSVHSQ